MNSVTPPPLPAEPVKSRVRSAGLGLWLYAALQVLCSFLLSAGGSLLVSALFFLLMSLTSVTGGWSGELMRFFGQPLPDLITSLVLVIVTFVSGLGAWAFMKNRYPSLSPVPEGGKVNVEDCFWGLCMMFAASLAFSLLFMLLNTLFFDRMGISIVQDDLSCGSSGLSYLLLFIALCIGAPLCEELFFRGCLFRLFAEYNPLFAMIFSSLCFGMMHLNLAQGLPTFFMGLVLSWYVWKTGSIKTSIILHALNNFIAFLSLFPIMALPANLAVWILAIAGFGFLISRFRQIRGFIRQHRNGCRLKLCFGSGSMIAFGVFFLVYSVGSLFL